MNFSSKKISECTMKLKKYRSRRGAYAPCRSSHLVLFILHRFIQQKQGLAFNGKSWIRCITSGRSKGSLLAQPFHQNFFSCIFREKLANPNPNPSRLAQPLWKNLDPPLITTTELSAMHWRIQVGGHQGRAPTPLGPIFFFIFMQFWWKIGQNNK